MEHHVITMKARCALIQRGSKFWYSINGSSRSD